MPLDSIKIWTKTIGFNSFNFHNSFKFSFHDYPHHPKQETILGFAAFSRRVTGIWNAENYLHYMITEN